MRVGEPQPTIARNVGTGRLRRLSGVIDSERRRRYSWQFCTGISMISRWGWCEVFDEDDGCTYAAVEMANEYNKNAASDIRARVYRLEGDAFAVYV